MPRRPKVVDLPKDVRAWLDEALAEGNFCGYETLSAELKRRGYDISRSSVHRYGQRLERKLAAIRASTEAARQIAAAAPDDSDLRSAAVISLVQSDLFDALLALQEAEHADPADRVKLLAAAARAVAEASRASIGQKRWADEVRERLDAVEKTARQAGRTLDAQTLAEIRRGLYGG